MGNPDPKSVDLLLLHMAEHHPEAREVDHVRAIQVKRRRAFLEEHEGALGSRYFVLIASETRSAIRRELVLALAPGDVLVLATKAHPRDVFEANVDEVTLARLKESEAQRSNDDSYHIEMTQLPDSVQIVGKLDGRTEHFAFPARRFDAQAISVIADLASQLSGEDHSRFERARELLQRELQRISAKIHKIRFALEGCLISG
jgi:hypothetical protein